MTRALLEQALEALDNSLDSIMMEFEDSARMWENMPTKKAKVAELRGLVDAHEKAIEDIRAELAKPAQQERKPARSQSATKCGCYQPFCLSCYPVRSVTQQPKNKDDMP